MVGLYRLDAFASRDAPALPVFAEDGAVAETATATACNDAAGAGPGQQRQRQMQQQPRLGDALVYLNQVRREFQSQPNVLLLRRRNEQTNDAGCQQPESWTSSACLSKTKKETQRITGTSP